MSQAKPEKATVRVFRFDRTVDKEPHYDTFELPFNENESVLSVLHYIRDHFDKTLAYRYSCCTGNCVSCTYKVNGKAVVSCRTRMKQEMVIEPVKARSSLRDLMCNDGA